MSYTDFKEITNPTTGTGTKYGSSQILEIMQIFNGKTVADRRPKIINEWLWQNHFDMTEVAEPASPGTGNQRFFIDSSDHSLKLKKSDGSLTTLGGGVSVNQANTYGDYDQTFRSGRLDVRNPANTQSYSIVGSAIAAARNVTLPLLTANDVVVCEAMQQTLTNKTLTTPVISTISNSGTVTIPTGTDTLVAQSTNYNLTFALLQSAAYTTAQTTYIPINGNIFQNRTTEANVQCTFPFAIRLRRLIAKCSVNGNSANMTIGLRDDAATATSVTITSSSTNEFDSGAIDVTIAAGSKVNWILTTSGTVSFTLAHVIAIGSTY